MYVSLKGLGKNFRTGWITEKLKVPSCCPIVLSLGCFQDAQLCQQESALSIVQWFRGGCLVIGSSVLSSDPSCWHLVFFRCLPLAQFKSLKWEVHWQEKDPDSLRDTWCQQTAAPRMGESVQENHLQSEVWSPQSSLSKLHIWSRHLHEKTDLLGSLTKCTISCSTTR